MNPSAKLALLFVLGSAVQVLSAADGVSVVQQDDKVRVEINGQLFTEYYFKHVPRPYCYPLLGPRGTAMTRDWPMKDLPGEEHDHPHHRSLWFAHGNVNGLDFWSEQKNYCKTVHAKFLAVESGKNEGIIRTENHWVAPDGTVVCTDERTLQIYNRGPEERLFDFDITLYAPKNKEVVFGDTKEGTMAVRVAETMRVVHGKNEAGKGRIVLSTGVSDDGPGGAVARNEKKETNTWGKRAAWCDYSGPVDGKTVGIAIFDHPQNPRHPTSWHVRDYGLFAANPFGLHDFEKQPKGAGDLKIPAGQSVTFRYRFYLHEGNEKDAKVAERYAEYAGKSDK
jgi:hypothetical protein